MFQLIILAQLKEGADPLPLMEFLRAELPRQVPTVRRSEVREDLGLTKHLGHNATFCWIVDFDDQAGWQVYRDSAAHDTLCELLFPVAEQYLATQTIVEVEG
ncbi:Dabb family protein [Nocardioides humi]|uniref:Stress-response A/B barrel domain-containing protein n=1 Tax=Nocardioides humi TaxID=449461 RepID=A0ABN2B5F8_9ACTN|nr:Dabb family protein [Nocardioides humi]